MIFQHKGIEFNINENLMTKGEAISLFNQLPTCRGVEISEVNFEVEVGFNYVTMYIYMPNPITNQWDEKTLDYSWELEKKGFEVSLCDEDYGAFDVMMVDFHYRTAFAESFPSLIYNTHRSAEIDADSHKVEVCRIIYGDCVEDGRFIGWGLWDGKLLQQRDMVSV